jgi:2-oxo-4-hydroxy-4-carboxy--5-ureidoimidazoline (OHCU) decarboxylase
LNALYESVYPRLRYITFVAGRSRAQVAEDVERFLLKPTEEKDDEGSSAPPATHQVGSKEWKEELERALGDIFQIAKARLKGMGVE